MRAIRAALGRPVKEFHFLFIRPGVAVPVRALEQNNAELIVLVLVLVVVLGRSEDQFEDEDDDEDEDDSRSRASVLFRPCRAARWTMRTEMSAGLTPLMREAWPSVTGRISPSLRRASLLIWTSDS